MRLVWTKAHSGIRGNETSDLLAKRGADPLSGSPPHTVLPAFRVARKTIASLCLSLWRREWSAYPGGRMTKHFLPGPNPTQVSPLIQLDRVSLSQCIGFLTGHNDLRYHHSLRNPDICNACRFCGGGAETSSHLYAECPSFSTTRLHITGSYVLPIPITGWICDQLFTFLRVPAIARALSGLTPDYLRGLTAEWSESDPDPDGSDSSSSSLLE